MKHIPKYTPTEVLNDPYGFTYKEMSEVIERIKQKPYIPNCIKQSLAKKNLSISVEKIYKVTILKSMFMN